MKRNKKKNYHEYDIEEYIEEEMDFGGEEHFHNKKSKRRDKTKNGNPHRDKRRRKNKG